MAKPDREVSSLKRKLNLVGSSAHIFFGAWITLVFVYLFGPRSLYWTLPILIVGASIKEFWWDLNWVARRNKPRDQTGSWDGVIDVATYVVGGILTMLIVLIHVKTKV